jgi:hypothetical protein
LLTVSRDLLAIALFDRSHGHDVTCNRLFHRYRD